MHTSPGFERSIQTIRAVKDYGWTYPSNYLDIYFEKISEEQNIAWMEVGSHCLSHTGVMSLPAFGVFVDVALSNAARASLGQQASLATIGLRLGIHQLPSVGKIKSVSKIKNRLENAQIGAVFTEVDIYCEAGRLLASGSALMGMAPFKNALDVQELPAKPKDFAPVQDCLPLTAPYDILIFEAAQKAQSSGNGASFIDNFWAAQALSNSHTGAGTRFSKGQHLANRAGNVHGGILYGIAAQAAATVAPAGWQIAESSVQYLNAASDEAFTTDTQVLRQGRNTAVVACQVTSNKGKPVIHSQWTFLKPQSQ